MVSDLFDLPTAREYLRHIGAQPRGMWKAVVVERQGRYARDVAFVRLKKDDSGCHLTVTAEDGDGAAAYQPSDGVRQVIQFEAAQARWPEYVKPHSPRNLPDGLNKAYRADAVFEFRDAEGLLIILQQRVDEPGKDKRYVPWTYWSDNRWRQLEPDGPLPLWGIDQLKKHELVFLHEGAKAARAVRRMVEADTPEAKAALAAHPWGKELQHAAYLGWIGGALNPQRTDWSPLANAKRIVIVAENDGPGHDAVPKIARLLAAYPVTVEAVRFTTEQWPLSFDLADPFPEKLFKQGR
jgi:hypothetical protein